MESDNLLGHESIWYPLSFLGITHPLTGLNIHTIIHTWIAIGSLLIFVLISRYFLFNKNSLGQYTLLGLFKNFISLIEQSVGIFIDRYFLFITSLFLYILFCNWIGLIPYLEEPTKDLNTTLALGITTFLYIHKEVIQTHGFLHFIKEIFMPFSIVFPLNLIAGILMLPLKLLGEFATVISLSFRLFGNIFGGYIITAIYKKALSGSLLLNILSLGLGINILLSCFFVIFEGFLQAFVFAILSLTNIAMAVKTEDKGIT